MNRLKNRVTTNQPAGHAERKKEGKIERWKRGGKEERRKRVRRSGRYGGRHERRKL